MNATENDLKKVLIVEDDDDIRLGMKVLLGDEFETFCAEDGISAMVTARRERVHAIVLDLGLAGGDGMKVLEWLREAPDLASTPTIVVTGRDAADLESRVSELGATRMFRKPADPGELLETIRLAIETHTVRPRALVIVTDPETREALGTRLRAADVVVCFAADGATALMTARNVRPDVILLDLGLPDGQGLRLLERLKAMECTVDVPVIGLTAGDIESASERVLETGAEAFLLDPADERELLEAIGAAL